MNDSNLKSRIRKLKKRWKKSRLPGKRFGMIPYLASVYRFYSRLRDQVVAKKTAERLAVLKSMPKRPVHAFRIFLDASCIEDERTKSRWTQALRYAWKWRSKWDDLEAFFKANGGLSGCANRMAHNTPPS
jgi:hypothetical protein